MSWILNGVTLPNPKEFTREFIETSGENISLTGRTTKDIRNRKERFHLVFRFQTPAEVTSLLSIYNEEEVVDFQVTETNLTIAATPVHVELSQRDYIKGGDYMADWDLILTEVS